MTYLITGETEESRLDILDILFEKFFNESFRSLSDKGDNPDIHILDGRGESSIGIEDVKNLQSELFFHPFENNFQIGIVFEAEKLTHEAQNAFLKTLEESSDETIFILCTKNEKNLLPTIVSRSRKIFAPKNGEDIEKEKTSVKGSIVDLFSKVEEIAKDKGQSLEFLESLEENYKENLEKNISKKDMKKSFSEKQKLEDIQVARKRILANGNRRLVLENLILRLKK
jgi:DNA polymerase III delta prime subunit